MPVGGVSRQPGWVTQAVRLAGGAIPEGMEDGLGKF